MTPLHPCSFLDRWCRHTIHAVVSTNKKLIFILTIRGEIFLFTRQIELRSLRFMRCYSQWQCLTVIIYQWSRRGTLQIDIDHRVAQNIRQNSEYISSVKTLPLYGGRSDKFIYLQTFVDLRQRHRFYQNVSKSLKFIF